ncbi:MAG: hypothetical protein ABR577_10465 [Pyrinomonadaceae bacterium]
MIDDSSMEFDMFEEVRLKLAEVFEREGHTQIRAEKMALYIVQGIREMPKLLTAVSAEETGDQTSRRILEAVRALLDSAPALERARNILMGLDEQSGES